MKITRWSAAAVADFIAWHEGVLQANGYGKDVTAELRMARDKFIAGVTPAEGAP